MLLDSFQNKTPSINKSVKSYLRHPLFSIAIVNIFYNNWLKLKSFEEIYQDILSDNKILREFLMELRKNENANNKTIDENIYFKNTITDILSYLETSFELSHQYWIEKTKNDVSEKVYKILWTQDITNETLILYKLWLPFQIKNKTKLKKYNKIKTINILSLKSIININFFPKTLYQVVTNIWEIIITNEGWILIHPYLNTILSNIETNEIENYWTIIQVHLLSQKKSILQNAFYEKIFTDDKREIISFISISDEYIEWKSLYKVLLDDWNTVIINNNNTILKQDNYFDIIRWNNKSSSWEPFNNFPDIIKFDDIYIVLMDWVYLSNYKEYFTNSIWNKIQSINWWIPWNDWEKLLIVNDWINWYHYLNKKFQILTYNWSIVNNIPIKSDNNIIELSDTQNPNNWFINIDIDTKQWIKKERVKKCKLKFI